MLNPRWKNVYKEIDWKTWRKIQSMAPDVLYYAMKDINYLLDKYYRTENGGFIGEGVSDRARFEIINRTMNELAQSIENEKRNTAPEESLETKIQKEEDLYERASIKLSAREDDIIAPPSGKIVGRGWLSPDGTPYPVRFNNLHGDWAFEYYNWLHKNCGFTLSPQTLAEAEHFSDKEYDAIRDQLIRQCGWIRVWYRDFDLVFSVRDYEREKRNILESIDLGYVPTPTSGRILIYDVNHGDKEIQISSDDLEKQLIFASIKLSSRDAVKETIEYWNQAGNKDFSKYYRKLRKKKKK